MNSTDLANALQGPTGPGQHPPGPPPNGECRLLGPFAILVQAALGALALLSLVFKRWRERPQRPIKIWAFDVSKQVFGTVLLHLANLLMSMFSAGEIQAQIATAAAKTIGAAPKDEPFRPNPCSFYLLNLAIDTTLGIPILIGLLKILTLGIMQTPLANPPESLKSGNYGSPPKVTWWLKQAVIYFVGLLLMKACVFLIFEACPWIVKVGDWALKWTEGNEALQIAFVMLIFPLIMNAMQYYVIDTFIKNKPQPDDDTERTDQDSADEHGRLLASEDGRGSSSLDEDEEVENNKSGQFRVSKTKLNAPEEVYDPDKDGEVETLRAEGSRASTSTVSIHAKDRSKQRSEGQ